MNQLYEIPEHTPPLKREAKRIENIRLYLSENVSTDLHTYTVAKKFRLSISSLHHLFKKHQGQSYRQYLETIRMNKAWALLQTQGISIKEVMYACGYKNRNTFNNAFKKRFRFPPGHFKK